MIGGHPDADGFADTVVVMAGHERQHACTAIKLQRVQNLRAAERLADHDGLLGAGVVMLDVVRA